MHETICRRLANCVLLFALLLLAGRPVCAELRFTELGTISGEPGILSVYLVEGGTPSPAAAVKIREVGKVGESNVLVGPVELTRLKDLCAQAVRYQDKVAKGQVVLLGSIPSANNKLDVAVVNYGGVRVAVLVAHEDDKEHTLVLNRSNAAALSKLIEKTRARLRP